MSNRIYIITFLISLKLTEFFIESKTTVNLCKDITSHSKELQLKTHLFCDYDPDVRPQTDKKKKIEIGMTVMPKMIEFDDLTNVISVHSWTAMNWTDPFLSWDPAKYGSLDLLHVKSDNLWLPDVKVHNSGNADDSQDFPDTDCNLFHDGSIICVPAIKYTAYCDSDYTNYPYDVQNCSLELTSWSYSTEDVVFHFPHGVIMTDYIPNQEWKIIESSSSSMSKEFKIDENYESNIFTIQFVLQRRAAGMHVVYIAPAIVLMVLTLSVLWLDCQSSERMIVASISFICHILCIHNLFFVIPFNGGSSPKLLRFYETSFLLMALSLVLTVLLRELRSIKTSAPGWLNSGTSLVLRSRPGQLLLLSILDPKASAFLESAADDNDDLVQANKPGDSTWAYVTLLLGWLAFVSTFFVYAIMFAIVLPTSYSVTDDNL